MRKATVVVSATGGSPKGIKYDYRRDKKTGKRVENLVRFEAPEMKGAKNPVARFQRVEVVNAGNEADTYLQYELFDADSGGTGAEIHRKLEAGIAASPVTNLVLLSRERTVLSKSDRNIAQWFRLDLI